MTKRQVGIGRERRGRGSGGERALFKFLVFVYNYDDINITETQPLFVSWKHGTFLQNIIILKKKSPRPPHPPLTLTTQKQKAPRGVVF